MATDKRAAELEFDDLLITLSGDRRYLKVCRNKGDAAGVARYERALEFDYARIREHCAKHDLKRPHDVPSEAHPTSSDTE